MIPGFISISPWPIVGLLVLLAIYALFLLALTIAGLMCLFRSKRRPWLGGVLLLMVGLWCFGPWGWSKWQTLRVAAAVEDMNYWPEEIDLSGKTLVFIESCGRWCFSLASQGFEGQVFVASNAVPENAIDTLENPNGYEWLRLTVGANPEGLPVTLYDQTPSDPPDQVDYLIATRGPSTTAQDLPGAPRLTPSFVLWVVDGHVVEPPLVLFRYAGVSERVMFLPFMARPNWVPSARPLWEAQDQWLCANLPTARECTN